MKAFLLIAASVCLAGCSANQKAPASQSASSIRSKTSQDSSALASTGKEEKPQASSQIQYNGSYYSVQGKYGEIVLVNKKYPLSPDYNPGEQPEAKEAFLKLLATMQAQGFAVSDQYSGFRSYDTQAELYQNYVAQDGQQEADRYSARPGHSEHQSGLAFDFIDHNGQLLEEQQASQWLAEHAHEYGFIVRYLKGKEAITGYMAETWHIRYIGQEATDIYQSGLTLEEYLGVEGGDYPS